jgi:hypothetical protein
MSFGLNQTRSLEGEEDRIPDRDGHREHVVQLEKLSQKLEEYFAIRRF